MIRNTALLVAILILIGTTLVSPDWPTASAQPSAIATLVASGDTYLKGGTPNTNQGASTFVRVRESGPNRGLVRFSQSEIQAAINGGTLVSVKLRMTIVDNGNNWGTTGRTVDIHRVLVDWTEGNGVNGEGATWNCPKDTNIANSVPDGLLWRDMGPPYKDGGSYLATLTSTVTITNGMSGTVEWNVTADVATFLAGTANYGWIIRKTDEASPGRVDFASKENSVISGRPQLVIAYIHPISKIVFTTSPQTLTAGLASTLMTIQTQDASGNPINVTLGTTITLSSTSDRGKFSLSTGPWIDVGSLTITAGSNSVSFYYKDTIADTPAITTAESPSQGWTDATQQESINPAVLDQFEFGPISSPQTSGVPFTITIAAKDVYGNTVTGYAGSNTLRDSTGTMSPTSANTFSSGVWTGSATITKAQAGVVITTTGSGKSGASSQFNVNPATCNKLVVTVYPSTLNAGSWTTQYTVQRQDQYGNPVTSGLITVNLTSTSTGLAEKFSETYDGRAVTFVTIADGSATADFYYYDEKAGTCTISVWATDVLGDSKPLTVGAASLDHITMSPDSKTVTAGESVTYAAQAFDKFGNSLRDVSDSTAWSIESGAGGSWSENVYTSAKVGTWTVTGTHSEKSDTASLTVTVAVLDHIVVSPKSVSVVAGLTQAFTAEAFDAYGNSLNDTTATTSWSIDSEAGGSWSGNVYTSEKAKTSWTVTGTCSGKSDTATLTVNPSSLASFAMTGYPSTATAGQGFGNNNVIITAYDAYGNVKTDYIGQVYFSSTDPQAVLPYTSESKYRFTTANGDNGVHTFEGISFILNTVGNQTIMVTDGTVSVTSSIITVVLAPVSIVITTSPAGSGFVKVDGSSIDTPQTFTWAIGSTHTLEALSPVTGDAGIQYVWVSWSDGGGQTHTYTAPSSSGTVTAQYGLPTSTGSGVACLTAGTGTLTDVSTVSESSLPSTGKPDFIFPDGFFSFKVTGLKPGDATTVTITLPSAVPVGTQYWKYGPTPTDATNHWYQLPMGDDNGDNVITITLVDGGLGDGDLTANGVIVDPGGPGVPLSPALGPVGGTMYSVNKPAVLLAYLALVGVVGVAVLAIRRRQPVTGKGETGGELRVAPRFRSIKRSVHTTTPKTIPSTS